MKSLSIISSIALLISAVVAQEGATVPSGATTAGPSTYSCDPNTCKIENNCLCASQSPPGGLSPADTPQVSNQFNYMVVYITHSQAVCYSNLR
jgi:hypothetical protein